MAPSFFPHVPTLAFSTVVVTAILGVLLLFTWLQDRSHRALLWWGPTYLLAAFGTTLLVLRGFIPDFFSMELANAVILLAAGCGWAGFRTFEGRRVSLVALLALALAWIVAFRLPLFANDLKLRITVASLVLGNLFVLSACELWRGRSEPLVSRWPAIVILGFYAVSVLARVPLAQVLPLPPAREIFHSNWFGYLALGTLVLCIASAFLMLALTKERTELCHRQAASIDSLTGLLNRRAFLASGEATLVKLASLQQPASVLVFDLDQFKQINDHYGHPVGDRVLQAFGRVAARELRKGDILGRLGGEEFAAVLPDCDRGHAWEAAERIRRTFARAMRQEGAARPCRHRQRRRGDRPGGEPRRIARRCRQRRLPRQGGGAELRPRRGECGDAAASGAVGRRAARGLSAPRQRLLYRRRPTIRA